MDIVSAPVSSYFQPALEASRLQEFKACLQLRHTARLGARTWKKILLHYGSAVTAVQSYRHWLQLGLANTSQVYNFENKSWQDKARKELEAAQAANMQVVLFSDSHYPELLRQISTPPLFLYALGDIDLLQSPAIGVVGSRACSDYGLKMAQSICRDLSRAGICIASGFAWGIDRQAHLTGLSQIGKSIAVLGTGLDIIYPAANRDLWDTMGSQGLILSEFAPGTKPEGRNFPVRNRIISGLCLGVLVVQAALKSGSMVTARLALEQNREVFALPGPAGLKTHEGCHHLIRQGAVLTQSAEDILLELAPLLSDFELIDGVGDTEEIKTVSSSCLNNQAKKEPDLSSLNTDERQIMGLLDEGSAHIDDLSRTLEMPSHQVSQLLLTLELQGHIKQLPGMHYALS